MGALTGWWILELLPGRETGYRMREYKFGTERWRRCCVTICSYQREERGSEDSEEWNIQVPGIRWNLQVSETLKVRNFTRLLTKGVYKWKQFLWRTDPPTRGAFCRYFCRGAASMSHWPWLGKLSDDAFESPYPCQSILTHVSITNFGKLIGPLI